MGIATPLAGSNSRTEEGFVADHRRWVYLLALRMLGEEDLAEDVAQDSLIRAVRRRHHLKDGDSERAWLRRIVVNQCISALGKRREVACADDSLQTDESDLTRDLAVRQVLAALNPQQQAILALAVGEQLSYEEIADAFDIPVGTVASRLHAAKAAFRKRWEREP